MPPDKPRPLQAIEIWNVVLGQRLHDRVPLHWARTQNGLGLALWRRGERESGTAHLEAGGNLRYSEYS
jgi:hypothetical protein